jgi:hypothetical protein
MYKKLKSWFTAATAMTVTAEIIIMTAISKNLAYWVGSDLFGENDNLTKLLGFFKILMHLFTFAIVAFTIMIALAISYLLNKSEK